MAKITAVMVTANASKYLQQLSKHFAHKVQAVWDNETAHVTFEPGECRMQATGDQLTITCESDDPEKFQQLIFVVEGHLIGFAWREDCELVWHDEAGQIVPKSEKLETGLAERRDRFAAKRRDSDDETPDA